MHILITGAAGMVGRKLTERLVGKGLNGKPIDKLTLVDVVKPSAPAGFRGQADARALDISADDTGRKLVAGRPDVIFHLAAVVSPESSAPNDGPHPALPGSGATLPEPDHLTNGFST